MCPMTLPLEEKKAVDAAVVADGGVVVGVRGVWVQCEGIQVPYWLRVTLSLGCLGHFGSGRF